MVTRKNTVNMDSNLVKFVSFYFYEKGLKDAKLNLVDNHKKVNLDKAMADCLKEYKLDAEEKRKENPHHHMNRLD